LEKRSQQILALIREQSDLTLNELVSTLRKRRIPASRSALSRFFARHDITFKKSLRAEERKRGEFWPISGSVFGALTKNWSNLEASLGFAAITLEPASARPSFCGRAIDSAVRVHMVAERFSGAGWVAVYASCCGASGRT
jgi:hypothetical protein